MDPATYRSRCLNPCDYYFWKTRGYTCRPDNWEDILENEGYWDSESEEYSDEEESDTDYDESDDYDDSESDEYDEEEWHRKKANDIKSRENNPCDKLYWQSRGYASRPPNWRDLARNNHRHRSNNNNQQLVLNPPIAENQNNQRLTYNIYAPRTVASGGSSGGVTIAQATVSVAGSSTGGAAAAASENLDNMCKVCWERPLNCLLLSCNHLCSCIDCASKLKNCPICRQKIAKIIRVYKS